MLDLALHVLGGGAIFAALYFGKLNAFVPIIILFGLLREQAQHRDEGWIGWLTWHRLGEALSWGLGAMLADATVRLGRWLWI